MGLLGGAARSDRLILSIAGGALRLSLGVGVLLGAIGAWLPNAGLLITAAVLLVPIPGGVFLARRRIADGDQAGAIAVLTVNLILTTLAVAPLGRAVLPVTVAAGPNPKQSRRCCSRRHAGHRGRWRPPRELRGGPA